MLISLKGGYKGTIHIVESAIAQGIKRIVVTGSIVSMWDGPYFPTDHEYLD